MTGRWTGRIFSSHFYIIYDSKILLQEVVGFPIIKLCWTGLVLCSIAMIELT